MVRIMMGTAQQFQEKLSSIFSSQDRFTLWKSAKIHVDPVTEILYYHWIEDWINPDEDRILEEQDAREWDALQKDLDEIDPPEEW